MFSNKIASRTLSLNSTVRIPSIRFRYGPARDQKPAAACSRQGSGGPANAPQSGAAIYDFQIPPRWQRRPLSEEEIAYINRGGPE